MKKLFVGKIESIRFTPFMGCKYPPGHPKADQRLPEGVKHYAVHGGGVSTEAALRLWGIANKVSVSFDMV